MRNLGLYRFDVTGIDGEKVVRHIFARTYAKDIPSAIESVVRDLPNGARGKFSGDIVEEITIAERKAELYKCAFTIEVFEKRVDTNVGVVYLRDGIGVVRV